MRSFFHSATKKVLDHSRVWLQRLLKLLKGPQVTVQHLVQGMTSASMTMQTGTLTPTPTLASLTLFQVECKTGKQSWLGLTASHLMRWRYSILSETENHQARPNFYHSTASSKILQHIPTGCNVSNIFLFFCATMLPQNTLP